MRLLPELEAYRDRLVARAAAWSDKPREALASELDHCAAQVSLLTGSVEGLKRRLGAAPHRIGPEGQHETERLAHRLAVQEQMRDLTAAFAEALRRHLADRERE